MWFFMRLYLLQCKEEDLRKEFTKFGELTEVKIPIKPGMLYISVGKYFFCI